MHEIPPCSQSTLDRVAIIGTVGVPSKYGGFETLAENLVRYGNELGRKIELTVYCSGKSYSERKPDYFGAKLIYLPISANGIQSVLYDVCSIISAIRRGNNRLLILGVSGCIVLPFLRRISDVEIIVNIDGLEWRRDKWNIFARMLLKFSEKLAVNYSDFVIADNEAIADYIKETYNKYVKVIEYGGDHSIANPPADIDDLNLPETYALGLCRIEPENNVEMILQAFSKATFCPLVFVGNWNNSNYGRSLRARFEHYKHLHLLDPVYDSNKLRGLRNRAHIYVHGHSAGGTNPSLVEMMHFGIPVLAYDCSYNRFTTENCAFYFGSTENLHRILLDSVLDDSIVGSSMLEIANRRYTWANIGRSYFDLFSLQSASHDEH